MLSSKQMWHDQMFSWSRIAVRPHQTTVFVCLIMSILPLEGRVPLGSQTTLSFALFLPMQEELWMQLCSCGRRRRSQQQQLKVL